MDPKESADSTIRVVVVNESGFIREGICQVIERFDNIEVVASIPSPHELSDMVQHMRIDVALIDAQLSNQEGFEATRRVHQSGANTQVVIQSVNPSLAEVKRAFQVGANGFLLREAGVDELEMALHAAVKGQVFLCPTIIRRLSEGRVEEAQPEVDHKPHIIAHDRHSIDDILSTALRLGILRQEQ